MSRRQESLVKTAIVLMAWLPWAPMALAQEEAAGSEAIGGEEAAPMAPTAEKAEGLGDQAPAADAVEAAPADAGKADGGKAVAEPEKAATTPEKATTTPEKATTAPDESTEATTTPEKASVDTDKALAEPEKRAEPAKAATDPAKASAGPAKAITEPEHAPTAPTQTDRGVENKGDARAEEAEEEPVAANAADASDGNDAKATEASSPAEDETPRSSTMFSRRVGSVKIHLGAFRPSFSKDLKYYDDLYGQPAVAPTFGLDYYFFNSAITFGVGGSFGYYKDTGKAASHVPLPGQSAEKDRTSSTELTLIPVQLNLKAQFSPFVDRWLVLSGWLGYQWLFIQETRFPQNTTTTTTTTPTTTNTTTGTTPASTQSTTYVNGGTNTEMVIGGGVSFRLDPLDRRSVSSLYPIGVRSVYLTPFMEVVTTMDDALGKFNRTNFGLLFTFETIK